jgi:hypothetical protein
MANQAKEELDQSFVQNIIQSSTMHVNLREHFIVTTEDKVRLCMIKHANSISRRGAWIAPFSLFITILIVLLTAEFQNKFSVLKATWQAFFILSAIGTLGWSIWAIIRAICTSTSVDLIVDTLKQSGDLEGVGDERNRQSLLLTAGETTAESFIILNARYGARNKFADVKDILNKRIVDGKLDLLVVNGNLVGEKKEDDPIYGVRKQLVVKYRFHGETCIRTVAEKETLRLP